MYVFHLLILDVEDTRNDDASAPGHSQLLEGVARAVVHGQLTEGQILAEAGDSENASMCFYFYTIHDGNNQTSSK